MPIREDLIEVLQGYLSWYCGRHRGPAARKDDRLEREEQARQREEERRRERAQREQYIHDRRTAALDTLLDDVGALDRLRRLITSLRAGQEPGGSVRVATFLAFAEAHLASRESSLSPESLEKRFDGERLFGDDDDHGFRSSQWY